MPEKNKKIKDLMAEADELIRQINTEVRDDMADHHRIQLEKHEQDVEQMKSELQSKNDADTPKASRLADSAEGMHEAMEDIVSAVKNLRDKLRVRHSKTPSDSP